MADTEEIVFNDQMILIGGVSGGGKSAALRNIRNQEKWIYLNTEALQQLKGDLAHYYDATVHP